MPLERTAQFHMRLSDDEDQMLRALIEAKGPTASDLFRQYIRREFAETFPAGKGKAKR